MARIRMIDTRDLYKRQYELEEEMEWLEEDVEAAEEAVAEAVDDGEQHFAGCDCELCEELERATTALADWREDYEDELKELRDLEVEIPDYQHGNTLIHTDDFEEYAQELAEDIGAIGRDDQWPVYCIDWERAANDLAMDYSVVTYEGEDYYYRA